MKLEDTVAWSWREGNEDDHFEIKRLSKTFTLQLLWRHVLAIIAIITVKSTLLITCHEKIHFTKKSSFKDELKRANAALKRGVAYHFGYWR